MRYFIFLFVLLVSLHAELTYSKSYNKCFYSDDLTTAKMLKCTYNEIKLQDTRLNKNYKKSMNGLREGKQDQLKKVQRLWIKYRDLKCDFYFDLTGSTIDKLNRASCLLELTTKRANELEDLDLQYPKSYLE